MITYQLNYEHLMPIRNAHQRAAAAAHIAHVDLSNLSTLSIAQYAGCCHSIVLFSVVLLNIWKCFIVLNAFGKKIA